MEKDKNFNNNIVYSNKMKAGHRRSYYFDVKRTRNDDFCIVLTESSKKHVDAHPQRHRIYVYKEDINRFQNELNDVINHLKEELLPNYDFTRFDNRDEDWEKSKDEHSKSTRFEPRHQPKTYEEEPEGDVSEEDIEW